MAIQNFAVINFAYYKGDGEKGGKQHEVQTSINTVNAASTHC